MTMLVRKPFSISGGYIIENAGQFGGTTSDNLSLTFGTGDSDKVFSFGVQGLKKHLNGSQQTIFGADATGSNNEFGILFDSNDRIEIRLGGTGYRTTSARFRDPTCLMSILVLVDTTQASAADRIKLYVNNVEITAFDVSSDPALNYSPPSVNTAVAHYLGRWGASAANPLDATAHGFYFADGITLSTTDVWESDDFGDDALPANLARVASWGTNGFIVQDPSTGVDSSGNGNDWTVNGTITQVGDTATDSVSKGVGNYATFNPVIPSAATLSNGNLTMHKSGAGNDVALTTLAADASNDTYVEFVVVATGGGSTQVGIIEVNPADSDTTKVGDTGGYGYRRDGGKDVNGSFSAGWGSTFTTADVIGVRLNAGTLTFYKNGSSEGNMATGLTGLFYFGASGESGASWTVRVDGTDWTQTPSGVTATNALATQNLPESTAILSEHLAVVLDTGTGSAKSVTGVGFQPDLVWRKDRDAANDHRLFDSIRGATKRLFVNTTAAESTDANSLTSLDSDGFSYGIDVGGNTNTNRYVSFCMSLPTDYSGATTGAGTAKTYTTKLNQTLGVELIKFTGNGTAGHTIPLNMGLGIAPFMVIIKNLDATEPFLIWHEGLTSAAYFLNLTSTNAELSNSTIWNSTAPTSLAMTLGSNTATNANTQGHLALVFYETDLCKKVGPYEGNASADGIVDYKAGLVEWLMVKNIDAAGSWPIHDGVRNPTNPHTGTLFADTSAAENSDADIDRLATGWKARRSSTSFNSANTFVGVAFVNPLNPKGRGQGRGVPQ